MVWFVCVTVVILVIVDTQVCENIKLPSALLSRFDLVFVMLDNPDEGRDRLISEHIMRRSAPSTISITSQQSQQHSSAMSIGADVAESRDPLSHAQSTLSQRIRTWIRQAEDESAADPFRAANDELTVTARLRQKLLRTPEVLRKYIEYSRR